MEIDGQCHCGQGDLSGRHRSRESIDLPLHRLPEPDGLTVPGHGDLLRGTGPHDGRAGEDLRQDRRQRPHALPAFLRGAAVPRCSPAATAGRTTGASAGAASASAISSSRRGKSGAAPPRHGSTISGICRDGRATSAARPPELSNLASKGAAGLNRRRGRLAQLVRASRLHREGRQFESVAAYQPSPCELRLGSASTGREARRLSRRSSKSEGGLFDCAKTERSEISKEDRANGRPTGHEQNADQIAYWNGPAGQRWAERQAAQDIVLGRSLTS